MLKKFDKFKSVQGGNYYEKYKRENVVEPFLIVVGKCKEYIENIPLEEAEQALEEIERTKIVDEIADPEYLQKNNRVKPLTQVVASENPQFERKDTLETEKSVMIQNQTEIQVTEEEEAENVDEEAAELENMRKQIKNKKEI